MKRFFRNHTNIRRVLFLALFILSISPTRTVAEEKWHRVETVLHLHSQYSFRGKLTPEDIIKNAREKGVQALIFTDHALVKISYGLSPFRRLLQFSAEENSVYKKGIHRYFKELETLNRKYPDLLVIPSVEATPFYY